MRRSVKATHKRGTASRANLGSLSLLCALLQPTAAASAQTALASILGTVQDAQGRVLQGATVTVRNTDLGTVRTITAGSRGSFRVDGLASGAYTVDAKGSGLATRKPLRLTLTLGSSTEVQLRTEPARVSQSTRITGRGGTVEGNTTAPVANLSEASLSTFLPGLTVTYLPNRGRNITQFTSLTAGAQEDEDGSGVVLNGQRSDNLATQLDGISFVSPLFGGPRGGGSGGDGGAGILFLPLTAVREFELVRTGADAAVGRTTAGLINLVTKGGANRRRGEAFYTGRPSQFGSADAFGRPLDNVQNAFGASYGGPLQRDRTFYLASFEQDFLYSPYYSQFDPQAPGTAIPAGLLAQQGEIVAHQSATAGFLRFDANLNPANALSLELALNRIRATNVDSTYAGLTRSFASLAHASALSGQSVTSRAGLTSSLSSLLFNNAAVAWSSDHRNTTPNSAAPEQFINGFGTLGGTADGQRLYTTQRTQLLDDLTLSHGRDSFTVGGNLAIDPAYEQKELNTNGRFDYTSLTDFLNNNPRRFQQTFLTGDIRYRGTVSLLGFYLNARLALAPRLFLTAGLRWDAQWNPQPPAANAAVNITQRVASDLTQWQPRLGLAWSPDTKTVLRVSSGLYAAPTPGAFFHRVFTDSGAQTLTVDSYFDPQLLLLTAGNAPHALAAAPAGLTQQHAEVLGIAPTFRNPTSAQAAASLTRQLLPKLELTLGYVHNSTWRLERQLDANLAPPVISVDGTPLFTTPRPYASVGRLLLEQSTAHSGYDGGSIAINAPISRRSQLLLNYTLARTRDDDSATSPYSPATAVNPFFLTAERGYSNLDVRHSLNVNAIFNLPAGFKLNPLLQTRSGLPYTPVVGFDRQGDANDLNDRALLNGLSSLIAPRNSLRQPAFSDLDLRLVKDFTLKGEGHHLDLFMDVFNLAGAGNRRFGLDAVDFYGDPSHPVFSAGQPLFAPGVARFGGPRTFQLTARLVGF